jgi:GT2 family glycosyltransferase
LIELVIVDNSPNGTAASKLDRLARAQLPDDISVHLITGHGNVGYGSALNLALLKANCDICIASNPDIIIAPEALRATVSSLRQNPAAGILSPCFRISGQQTHLCKRLPSALALCARRLPHMFQPLFRKILDHYEMRDRPSSKSWWSPPVASGAFLIFRSEILKQIQGFDEKYFLYFEDFDICVRAQRVSALLYTPDVLVAHTQNRSGKNWQRFFFLCCSAVRFWRQHGFSLFWPREGTTGFKDAAPRSYDSIVA